MFKAIAFGLSVGAGVQAWRNWPPDGPVTPNAGIVVLLAAVVAAYLAGRWAGRGHGGASAVASARAEASAAAVAAPVQVVNVVLERDFRDTAARYETAGGVSVPSDSAPWLVGARTAVDESLLEGADLRDLGLGLDEEAHE